MPVDVFEVREQLVADYSSFTSSFVEPRDERIKELLDRRDEDGGQWPEPWLSLNPNFGDEVGVVGPVCRWRPCDDASCCGGWRAPGEVGVRGPGFVPVDRV